ncbi:MAG: TonB-dependent receptor [Oxalobacteraceae bacterium]|nr:MAG: TonB-dependent receptor [Oxalobacteraceae bacterium]
MQHPTRTYAIYTSSLDAVDLLTFNAGRSNTFAYDQQVLATYASLKLTNQTKWTLQSGVRLENTVMDGRFADSIPPFRIRFTNIIPSVILSKQLDERQSVKVSYTQRISRPMIWDLNPFINASDPKNLSAGNPLLRPELTCFRNLSINSPPGPAASGPPTRAPGKARRIPSTA